MKRDLILVGKIFEILLNLPYSRVEKTVAIDIEGYSKAAIDYHIELLKDVDMIKTLPDGNGRELPTRIKWKGHEYVDKNYTTVLEEGLSLITKIID